MSSDDLVFGIGAQVVAYVGIVMGSVAMPFAASFLLDGIVQLLRGNGPKLFVLAFAFTAVLSGGGYALRQFGAGNPTAAPAMEALMFTVAKYLITFSTVLALVGFGSRTVKLLWSGR